MRLGSILGSEQDRVGLMLLPSQEGLLIGRKQQMLDGVVPSVQEYGSAPVYRERTWTFKPTGGYGERVQSSYGDKRYYWGIDIQVSGGLVGKGPLLHPVKPATSKGPVNKFIVALYGIEQVLFTLSGNNVFRRAGDADADQVMVVEWGHAATDAARFQGGYPNAKDCLYVAWSAAPGTTLRLLEIPPSGPQNWCSLPAEFEPEFVEVVGD